MSIFKSCFGGGAKTSPQQPTTVQTNDESFFRFETGRWLWDEKTQRDKRYRRFNIAALQEIAISKVGAKRCTGMSKISEIGGNKVFRLTFDNRKTAIAKIPHWRAECGSLRVASEVATMDFALTILRMPVPKVLAWSADDSNIVGTEYILMEEAKGTLLEDIWDGQHPDSKAEILKELATLCGKFTEINFSCIGNLYFAKDNIPGAVAAVVGGNLVPPDVKIKIRERYAIGPTVTRESYEDGRAKVQGAQGPWTDTQSWLKSIAAREITWLQDYAQERTQKPNMPKPKGTKEEHIELWKKFGAASDFTNSIKPEFLRPTLWHADLRNTNIFCKKGKITALIDWEGTWVTPLLFAVQQPHMLMPSPDLLPQMPDPTQIAHLPDGPEKMKVIKSIEFHYLRYAWQYTLNASSPVFEQLEAVPLQLTLQQLVIQARETWQFGRMPLTDCLITVQNHWNELCPGRPCPYAFSQDEQAKHAAEEQEFGLVAMLTVMAYGVVSGDGFVKTQADYDLLCMLYSDLREKSKGLEGEEREEMQGALAWTVKE